MREGAKMSDPPPKGHNNDALPRLALRPKDAALALGIGARKLWEITADQTSGIPHVRLGKAGRKRHLGRRPHVRGTAMNPVAHPLGGGEGRSGGGRHPCSPWGKLAKALKDVVEPEAFAAFEGTTSLPFETGKYGRIAVKVIDPRGSEVMTIHKLEG